jgi:thiol-disulfide isomerase/thioredoxin
MRQKSRYGLFLGLGFIASVGVWLFREPLRSRIEQKAVFANPTPPPELVEEIIEKSPDRTAAIIAAWNTGKIVHRQAAVREISRAFPAGKSLPTEIESVILTGALDVDMNVRETALGILRDRNHSALPSLAAAQVQNSDPQVRLLGLNYLKRVNANIGVPVVIPLLDEDDPLIVATALKLMENWSGENFGVKLRDTASFEDPATGLKQFPEGSREKAQAGAGRAKAWWGAHQADFPRIQLEVPRVAITARKPVTAGDFSLLALDGRKVRLAELRGKIVLINFWTTWCPACLSEMPELIALQKQHAEQLAIIGVSLDFVPDSHGHIGGHPAVEERVGHAEEDSDEPNSRALKKVREKVARTVKARGINYTILLDEKNEVGGRFNGGELPTTVIVDANGKVRRRFVGARGLAVFEAMITEASQPEQLALERSVQSTQ